MDSCVCLCGCNLAHAGHACTTATCEHAQGTCPVTFSRPTGHVPALEPSAQATRPQCPGRAGAWCVGTGRWRASCATHWRCGRRGSWHDAENHPRPQPCSARCFTRTSAVRLQGTLEVPGSHGEAMAGPRRSHGKVSARQESGKQLLRCCPGFEKRCHVLVGNTPKAHLVLLGSMSLFSPYLRHRYPSSGRCTACRPCRRLLRGPSMRAVAMERRLSAWKFQGPKKAGPDAALSTNGRTRK